MIKHYRENNHIVAEWRRSKTHVIKMKFKSVEALYDFIMYREF